MPDAPTPEDLDSGAMVQRRAQVPVDCAGQRLDRILVQLFPEFSRSRLQQWIRDGAVRVDGRCCPAKHRLDGGERIELQARLEIVDPMARPQAQSFELIDADDQLFVINKPAGLVMHPAPGNPDQTLMNGLLHLDSNLAALPRAGIVHRLDKDTTGLLVVARTLAAHQALAAAIQARRVHREYLALVVGEVMAGGSVDAPIGRHPVDRKRMAVVTGGRAARTHYRVAQRLAGLTLLRCVLDTGRTHQIRVHLSSIGHPLVGDPVYGGRLRVPAGIGADRVEALKAFRRQALHACRLELTHPHSGLQRRWQAPLPADFSELLCCLGGDANER